MDAHRRSVLLAVVIVALVVLAGLIVLGIARALYAESHPPVVCVQEGTLGRFCERFTNQ
jgi:hypothetical protein